ncbi:MAG TPA: hypothetical protein VFY93_13225 [Planctomycetota bacterium]|nr:hypothetical protein [Planctomycetota bacterium]
MSGSAALRTFGVCLWKEWRDHRAVLLGMVLIVPLLLALLALALPRKMFDHPGFADNTAVACLAILVISLATDLVPGEARRGHRVFLERLPGGLRAPFLAKLVLFVASALVFTAFGYASGAETCYLVCGAVPSLFSAGPTTWILALAALWTFALSCALPRGALSLPAAGALALVVGLPILVCREIEPTTGVPSLFTSWSVALWAAGAVVAAWLAIRRTALLRAGGACLAVGAVCAVPFWADAVHYVTCPEPRIWEGWLGEGGRYAFVECMRQVPPGTQGRARPLPPLVVDLRDGTSRELSADRAYWLHGLSREGFPQRFISLGSQMFDARTAEPANPRQDEIRDALRAAAPSRLPGGRRMWVFGNHLEADGLDGGVEVLENRWWSDFCRGQGGEVNGHRIYDATRRRYYERNALGLRLLQNLWVRAGRWLVKRAERGQYELLDPDTGEFAPAVGFGPKDWACAMLDDGRMIVKRDGALLLLDPETGETVPQPNLSGISEYRSGRTPDGRRVLLQRQRTRCALARFDPATDTFATTAWIECDWCPFLLACPTDDTAIVHDGRVLYRLHFGSDAKEEIWRVR